MTNPNTKPPEKSDTDDALVTHTHLETPAEVAEYWTLERMNAAKPVPMPVVVAQPVSSVPNPTPIPTPPDSR